MTQQGSGSAGEEIQFDRAEMATPTAQVCVGCKKPVQNVYYTVNKRIVCAPCREQYLAQKNSGSKPSRVFRATVYGIGAGIVGAIIWFAVRKITNYELALIAILVGVMVGQAVRKGSGGRGGLGYQLLAVLLTYSCIVAQYVPDVFTGLQEGYSHRHADSSSAKSPQVAQTSSPTISPTQTADASSFKHEKFQDMSTPRKVGLLALFAVLLFGIAFVAPIMAGMQNVIGLFIIGIGMWQAWRINRSRAVVFTGPHALAQAGA